MRLTIIPSDKAVGVDEFFFSLELSDCSIPSNIHALQWYETEGEIEFISNPDRTKPQNEIISELPTWANTCIDKWNQAKTAQEAAIAAAAETAAANQPQTTGTQTA
jgi:hypothetical protein